jgi:hypothetical protein
MAWAVCQHRPYKQLRSNTRSTPIQWLSMYNAQQTQCCGTKIQTIEA